MAADLDGDGDLDVLAVSFLPEMGFPQRKQLDLDAVVILEQTAPGKFARSGSADPAGGTRNDNKFLFGRQILHHFDPLFPVEGAKREASTLVRCSSTSIEG